MGYPPLFLLGNMVATLDFDNTRSRKNIDGEIPGSFLWNQFNSENQGEPSVKDPNGPQTKMAEWTQDAFRWAYPFGRMPGYPVSMPKEVEEAIVRGRTANPITSDELEAWCTLINAAAKIPQLYA